MQNERDSIYITKYQLVCKKSGIFSRPDYRRSRTNSNRFYSNIVSLRYGCRNFFENPWITVIINLNGLRRSTKDRKDESKRGTRAFE